MITQASDRKLIVMPPDPLLIEERLKNVRHLLEHLYDSTCSEWQGAGIPLCEIVEGLCVKEEGARWKLRIAKQSSGPVKRELLFDLKKSVEELEMTVEWVAHSDPLCSEPQSIAVM
jgi:hypothetical protein